MIDVLLADDQALVRSGLRVLFESEPGFAVVGEAANGAEAVALARELRPRVLLMDVRMPVLDGIEATRRISELEELAQVRVLMLTTFESDEYVFEALRAGAGGFLLKDAEPRDILEAVRVLAAGEALLAPSVTRRLIEAFAGRAPADAPVPSALAELTEREREVMALVALGLSNEEIAQRLTISPATAKTHVSRAMLKLDARDRAQLVVIAYQTGLVAPGVR